MAFLTEFLTENKRSKKLWSKLPSDRPVKKFWPKLWPIQIGHKNFWPNFVTGFFGQKFILTENLTGYFRSKLVLTDTVTGFCRSKISFDRKFDRIFGQKIFWPTYSVEISVEIVHTDRLFGQKIGQKKHSNPFFTHITFSIWTIKLLTMRTLDFVLLWNEKCNNWCFDQLQNYTSKQ